MAAIPATAIATPGTVPVTVTKPGTPGGGTASETSNAVNFTVKKGLAPESRKRVL